MLFRKTIDGLIAGITRQISDLREVGEQHAADANEHNAKAKQYEQASQDASDEADRAFAIADRFEKLITI